MRATQAVLPAGPPALQAWRPAPHPANRCVRRESYDHWVRDEAEFERIKRYIENNPVKAGLVAQASDYPWSSAVKAEAPGIEKSLDAANKSVHATMRGPAIFSEL